MYLGDDREHFLRISDKLFYVDSDEFGEIDLDAISAKENGPDLEPPAQVMTYFPVGPNTLDWIEVSVGVAR
jgi:hypothetical protein